MNKLAFTSRSHTSSTPSGYLVLSEDVAADVSCLALFSSSRASAASSRLLAMYTMENRMAEIVKLPDKEATCEIQSMRHQGAHHLRGCIAKYRYTTAAITEMLYQDTQDI